MYYLSNSFYTKILIIAVRILYKVDYKYTLFLRKIYSKILKFFKNIIKVLTCGTSDTFNEIGIETTTYCNRSCSYCPNSIFDRGSKENEKLMDQELFKKIIDDLAGINYRGRIYPYFYGEPLLDNRLLDFMDYTHKKLPKAKIIISTNGDFLDTQLLDKFYAVGVRTFWVTLHSNAQNGTKKIKELMKYIKFNGKKIIILCQIINKNTPLSTRIGLVKVENERKDGLQCFSPFYINYKGEVLLCCNDYLGASNIFGNARNEKITEIWRKENFMKIRKQLSNHEYILDICKKCVSS